MLDSPHCFSWKIIVKEERLKSAHQTWEVSDDDEDGGGGALPQNKTGLTFLDPTERNAYNEKVY